MSVEYDFSVDQAAPWVEPITLYATAGQALDLTNSQVSCEWRNYWGQVVAWAGTSGLTAPTTAGLILGTITVLEPTTGGQLQIGLPALPPAAYLYRLQLLDESGANPQPQLRGQFFIFRS